MQTSHPAPVAPPNAHSRVIRSGQPARAAIDPAASAVRLHAGRARVLIRPEGASTSCGGRGGNLSGAGRMPVTADRCQVDLDEMRRGSNRSFCKRRGNGRIRAEVRCCRPRGECREVGHVRRGLGDRERHLGRLQKRVAEREVSLLGRARIVAHRRKHAGECVGVRIGERHQAGAQRAGLSCDPRVRRATASSRARPSSRARRPSPQRRQRRCHHTVTGRGLELVQEILEAPACPQPRLSRRAPPCHARRCLRR